MNKMSRVFLMPGMLCSLSQSLTSICRANLSMASQAGSIVNNVLRIVDGDEETVERALDRAKSVLQQGGVIALPTDTIYGIGALVTSDVAIKKLYSIKGRQKSKPVAICVGDIEDMSKWAKCDNCSDLLRDLLPGKVTTIFERKEALNSNLNPGVSLVGIRIPDHQFVRRLVRCCGHPIALTSANISDTKSTLDVEEFREIWDKIDLVIDGGRIMGDDDPESRLGSTVVNLAEDGKFSIIRPGSSCHEVVDLLKRKYQMTEFNAKN